MMDLAGESVASTAEALGLVESGGEVLVLVGPGNNGGDGLVAARALRTLDHPVVVYIWRREVAGDANYAAISGAEGTTILWSDEDPGHARLRAVARRAGLVIDALLGTGVARALEPSLAGLLDVVRVVLAERRAPQAGPDAGQAPTRFPMAEALAFGLSAEPDDILPLPAVPAPETVVGDGGAGVAPADSWGDAGLAPWPEAPVLAVDCPSGMNCDTGALDPAALPATVTVTFAYPKWGHLQQPGAGACGLLAVADIGIAEAQATGVEVALLGPAEVCGWLPARPEGAHKGTFGKALIAAGSTCYTGAAYLAGLAASRTGAGLVTLAVPVPVHAALSGVLPEATWLPSPSGAGVHDGDSARQLLGAIPGYDALLVGPGLTTSAAAAAFMEQFTRPGALDRARWRGRVVADADALNLLAALPDWPSRLPPDSILTPHPGEMGRLAGASTAQVNAQRIGSARRAAATWGHVVLLKGPYGVIAAPDGRTAVLPFATPALATAGSGDVLAGAIVALVAQGVPPFEAACCGGYLHGQAGAQLGTTIGPAGVVARDIVGCLLQVLRTFHRSRARPGRCL
jgi:NAD(P)H-hydrate epimerase